MNKQIRLITVLLLSAFSLIACSYPPLTSNNTATEGAQQPVGAGNIVEQVALSWLDYADAKAEANFAIQKQDFHLLALNSHNLTLPGIDLNLFNLQQLQQQCGYKILQHSPEQLSEADELAFSQKLFNFAAQYNQLVFSACRDK